MNVTKKFRRLAQAARLFVFGLPQYAIGSIDVTNRCNLRCEHCYFFAESHKGEKELSVEEWVEKLEAMKAAGHPMMLCTWVGGEPMVRKKLIEIGRKYFKHNTIVTNGTMELPDWDDCNYVISIDGTEEAFARMRAPGIYQKIKQNVINHPELKIQISCVITSITKDCIEDLVKEWGPIARGGIIFDFFTPITNLDEMLWLDWPERDRMIDRILELKKKYPGIINMMDSTLELMRSKNAKQVTDNCLFSRKAFTLGPTGEHKGKCMMGDAADCDRCGCVVPFHMATLSNRRLMLKEALKAPFAPKRRDSPAPPQQPVQITSARPSWENSAQPDDAF
ncbi:MAG: Fe-coproporphyrin synthase [Blastocatellia bacterium]|jgi:MoaA/NifB/PqqE/SkfB family radical SAM enzyme|nr:Fe-coproporphyrin synthase [Blastocatellia bacterium]